MELSLFSVSYAGLWGQTRLYLPQFIAKAAELGYRSVMLMGKRPHLSPLDTTAERIEQTKATLAEQNVECAAIGGYTDFSAAAAEVPYAEMQIAYVESLAAIAAGLGAKLVRVFTAYEYDGTGPHSSWSLAVDCLRECCERAHARGVTLAVQNHHDVAVHTDALLELLHDIDRPNCRLGFDAWSPALRGEDLYEAARKAARYTAMTTNADYIRFPRYRYQPAVVNYQPQPPEMVRAVKFGSGSIDFDAFFRGLADGGFDGLCNYEMCSPLRGGGSEGNLDAYAKAYVGWMREHAM